MDAAITNACCRRRRPMGTKLQTFAFRLNGLPYRQSTSKIVTRRLRQNRDGKMNSTLRRSTPLSLCLALAGAIILGGCETAREAMDTVSTSSKDLWDAVSSPFSSDSGTGSRRDVTRERRDDVEQWERIRGSSDPTQFQNFIERYPDSALTHLARRRLATLQPTQGQQVSATYAGAKPPPPVLERGISGQLPEMALPGQFPTPWLLGRWAIDCSRTRGGNGVTYSQTPDNKVRVVRDDGSAAVYTVRRENDILVLDGNGLVYQDKIVSATELRAYAVRYNDQWHKVDLTYRKCH